MVRWSIARAAAILVVWGGSSGCPFLGDHFFRATGRVVDCTTLGPVADATITMVVDRGNNPGPYFLRNCQHDERDGTVRCAVGP